MRILWHSNAPWCPSGYGKQTALFSERIAGLGNEVAISANWGLAGAVMGWHNLAVYPTDEVWGNFLLKSLSDTYKADVVISLMDVWVLKPEEMKDIPLACWVPIDHDPCPPPVVKFFKKSGAIPIAMSKFGKDAMDKEGLESLYVPHAVDTKVYRPIHKSEKDRVREIAGIPKDAYVVGMVAQNRGTNPPRKAFPQALEAFGRFLKEVPNAYLYLHCTAFSPHNVYKTLNLPQIVKDLEIPPERVIFPSPLQLLHGYTDNDMRNLYGMLDVLLMPSYGEGFGVPIVEAQACGIPVIVNNWTAMPELVGAGWKHTGDRWYHEFMQSFYQIPNIQGIVGTLQMAYESRDNKELSKNARKFAELYDVDRVTEKYWRPTLEKLAIRVKKAG